MVFLCDEISLMFIYVTVLYFAAPSGHTRMTTDAKTFGLLYLSAMHRICISVGAIASAAHALN